MTIVYILLAILAALFIVGNCYVLFKMDEVAEIKEDLEWYSVYLDERSNRLASEEATLREMYKELKRELNKQKNGRGVVQEN